jgi:hypothetical protein
MDRSLRVFIGTFNAGNSPPGDLGSFIPAKGAQDFDILAIGLQEASYGCNSIQKHSEDAEEVKSAKKTKNKRLSKAGAIFMGAGAMAVAATGVGMVAMGAAAVAAGASVARDKYKHQKEHFIKKLKEHIGSGYICVEEHLLEIRIAVFVKCELQQHMSMVQKAHKATGIGGVIGNKGGVVVAFEICGTSLAFVNCHLAAHEGQQFLEKRNHDIGQIIHGVAHGGIKRGNDELMNDFTTSYHHCFWFGDLNYRIDLNIANGGGKEGEEIDAEIQKVQVRELVQRKDWMGLMSSDELSHQRQQQLVFAGFDEHPIRFAPTFKVQKGKCSTDPYKAFQAKRIPSYCDRVLFRSMGRRRSALRCIRYSSIPEITSSDHKPVHAHFELDILKPTGRV